ncbi:MAG: hypothetical protein Q9199_003152 [Rusavskia elegans]
MQNSLSDYLLVIWAVYHNDLRHQLLAAAEEPVHYAHPLKEDSVHAPLKLWLHFSVLGLIWRDHLRRKVTNPKSMRSAQRREKDCPRIAKRSTDDDSKLPQSNWGRSKNRVGSSEEEKSSSKKSTPEESPNPAIPVGPNPHEEFAKMILAGNSKDWGPEEKSRFVELRKTAIADTIAKTNGLITTLSNTADKVLKDCKRAAVCLIDEACQATHKLAKCSLRYGQHAYRQGSQISSLRMVLQPMTDVSGLDLENDKITLAPSFWLVLNKVTKSGDSYCAAMARLKELGLRKEIEKTIANEVVNAIRKRLNDIAHQDGQGNHNENEQAQAHGETQTD